MLAMLRMKMQFYRNVPPFNQQYLEKLELEINEKFGLASLWIPKRKMGALLTSYGYPCNSKKEIRNMKLIEEALHLCYG